METNPEPIKEILDELFSLLESLEAQSLALTQFLKDQGIATDKKLAPYLDQAGNASSVKWRAARARMRYLLSPVPKQASAPEKDKSKDKNRESEKPPAEKSSTDKQSTDKQPTDRQPTDKPSAEKSPTEQNKPERSRPAKDTAQNKSANADKNPKPTAKDDTKKSDALKNLNANS
jgi:hypothetical protein